MSAGKSPTDLTGYRWPFQDPVRTAEAALTREARSLADRWIRAASFERPISHQDIHSALDRWAAEMHWRPRMVARGICGVPTFDVRGYHTCIESENRPEANIVHLMRKATDEHLGAGYHQSYAVQCTTAVSVRLSQTSQAYDRGGYLRVIPSLAAMTIGAAQGLSMKHYKVHLPLLEAFEAGCMLVWQSPERLTYVERPRHYQFDQQGRLHSSNGRPALIWYDSIQYYYWHGSHVRQDVVTIPQDKITAVMVDKEWNTECRRVLLDRMGEDRYIIQSGMEPISHHDKFGTLYVQNFGNGRPVARLKVTNRSPEPDGTFKVYWLPINPDLYNGAAGQNAHAAAASTWRTKPGGDELFFKHWQDYNPIVET